MISVLPAIGRSLRIADYQIAAVFALSAVLWFLASPVWGRLSDRHGRKRLILIGTFGFVVSCVSFGAAIALGLRGGYEPMSVFILFLIARGIFGLFGSATNPASQAYIAERTAPQSRMAGMASLAGAYGLGTLIGPLIAPLMVLPPVGLAGPLYGFAALGLVTIIAVWSGLEEGGPTSIVEPVAPRPDAGKLPSIWRDPRVRPFLVYAFFAAACQTGQLQMLGFLIIDRLALSPDQAQPFVAWALLAGAAAALVAQGILISFKSITSHKLLIVAAVLCAIGSLMMIWPATFAMAVAGYSVASFGFGLARPGYTTSASMAARQTDQARVGGAIAAVNGVNVLLAPAFVWLYGKIHYVPFLIVALIMGALAAQTGMRVDRVAAS